MECRIGSTTTLLGTGNVLLAGGEAGLISNPQTTPRSEVTWVAARSVQNLNTLIPAGSGYQIQGSTCCRRVSCRTRSARLSTASRAGIPRWRVT